MDRLIQALIGLSTISGSDAIESINAREMWEKLQKNYGEKLEEKHIFLDIVEKKPLSIGANREYAEIFFSNLLSNAIKYNHENGKITVTIDQKSITIQDT